MKKVAFILIMSVRLFALLSIIAGVCLWSGKWAPQSQTIVLVHFVLGFLVAADVLGLAIVALISRIWALGALGIVFAVCLPATGFMQISTIGPNLGTPQIAHILIVLGAIGVAEASAAKIKRTA